MSASWTILPAVLPLLWWTGAVDAAAQVKDVGLPAFCVDASASVCTGEGRERAVTPGIDPKVNVASATRSPWINANAWRFRRNANASYLYEVDGKKAPLAIAEGFTYGVKAAVRSPEDLPRTAAMLRFLAGVGQQPLPVIADVSFVDDGSPQAGEAMNLLSRRNILFRRLSPDEKAPGKVVRIGSPEFPKSLLSNPSEFGDRVRRWLGDESRTLRVYGSENVLAYVTGNDRQVRVQLLNYTGNPVEGVRFRLRGHYRDLALQIFDAPDAKAEDVALSDDAAEFTIPVLHEYGIVDLKR